MFAMARRLWPTILRSDNTSAPQESTMRIVMALAAGLVATPVSAAVISGRVTDASGTPIPGALVKLERGGFQAVTEANGICNLPTTNELLQRRNAVNGASQDTAGAVEGARSNDGLGNQLNANGDMLVVSKSGYLDYVDAVRCPDARFSISMIVCADSVTDVEGNVYQAVQLGNQVWTVANLRTKRFNDGTPIPFDAATDAWKDNKTPMYCCPKNVTDPNVIKHFGLLYNFYAVDTRKLAPAGWHIPSSAEWTTFETHMISAGFNWDGSRSGDKIARAIAAKLSWNESTVPGTIGNDLTKNNASGFSAYGTGFRHESGIFEPVGNYTGWWTATAASSDHAGMIDLHGNQADWSNAHHYRSACGYSVRLVKDQLPAPAS